MTKPIKTVKELTDLAMSLSREAHQSQFDKSGNSYFEHVQRVGENFDPVKEPEEFMTAYLHDTLEDTLVVEEDLRYLGFPDSVVDAVLVLTHTKGENYDSYISRVARNPLAVKVKLADLEDNLGRIKQAPEEFRNRKEKTYTSAKKYLTNVARQLAQGERVTQTTKKETVNV